MSPFWPRGVLVFVVASSQFDTIVGDRADCASECARLVSIGARWTAEPVLGPFASLSRDKKARSSSSM